MTLKGHYALCYANHINRLLELATKIRKKIGPYCQRQKCRWYKVRADVRGDSVTGGPQKTVGSPKMKFIVISVAISAEPLELMPTLLYSDME